MSFLNVAVEKAGSVNKLAEELKISRQTIAKWQSGEVSPSIRNFAPVMAYVGATSVRCGQSSTDMVSFSAMQFGDATTPHEGDYISVPVVRDADLLDPDDFFIPQTNIAAFTLSLATYKTALGRPHQVGVSITDDAMAPLLERGDVVYVDRDDTHVTGKRSMYLVRDAATGKVCVRRVDEQQDGTDTWLHFMADSTDVPNAHYSIKRHYNGKRQNAILGRVIWARVDMQDL